ncbi:unnamed protein product, partial [Scytosiphon promiscuus]
AIYGGNVAALRLLLEAGANPNSTDLRGATPLMAVFEGAPVEAQEDMLRALADAGADFLRKNEKCGRLPIHYAASNGATTPIYKLLSSAPTTLNVTDKNGLSPLGCAALAGHGGTVCLLLSAGASDMEDWSVTGNSALIAAIGEGHEDVVQVLLEKGL